MNNENINLSEEILKELKRIKYLLREKQNKFLTVKEAAEYLGLQPSYVYKLVSAQVIPSSKPFGKVVYIPIRGLKRLQRETLVNPLFQKRSAFSPQTRDILNKVRKNASDL